MHLPLAPPSAPPPPFPDASDGGGRGVARVPVILGRGRFMLGEELGRGGMATVFRARDTVLGVDRAVKVIHPTFALDPSARERLKAEARAMARVDHPNVLRVVDIGWEDGVDSIVMELIQGGSLQERLDREGPLPPAEAVRYVSEILAALAAAHAAGVIHRDVKPQNVLIGPDGGARLADFGIALQIDGEGPRSTSAGIGMGSLAYMPPEQRFDARRVGPAADVYAAGATLYALLTGGNPVDLYAAGPDSERWAPVHPALRPVIEKATRAIAAERYGSAAEMADALRAAAAAGLAPFTPVPRDWGGPAPTATKILVRPGPLGDSALTAIVRPTPVRRPHPDGRAVALMFALGVGLAGMALFHATGAPVAEALEPAVAALSEPTPLGQWTGTFGGFPARLLLSGTPAAVEGTLVVRNGAAEIQARLRGTIAENGAFIAVDTVEAAAAGAWSGIVNLERGTLRGTYTDAHTARETPIAFRRVAP